MTYGPMQLSVVAFDNDEVIGGLLDELDRVREFGIIRLIDFLFVTKDQQGDIAALEVTDMTGEERVEFGAVVGGLIGLGAAGAEGAVEGAVAGALAVAEHDFGLAAEEIEQVADRIPKGSSAVVALFEHLDSGVVQQNPEYFDFNGNAMLDMGDVVALFELIISN